MTRFGPADLSYKGVRLTQASLRDFLRGYIIDITQVLANDLLLRFGHFERLCTEIYISDFAREEDLSNTTANFSFLRGPRAQGKAYEDFLLRYILSHDSATWYLTSHKGNYLINRATAQAYLSKVATFIKDITLLIHLSSGAPARGTEITTL